jgi:hypothetical protein
MKCYHCEHYDNNTDICDVDGSVVINPWSDAECDYLKEPQTVFHQITASPEVLAHYLVRLTCFHNLDGSADLLFASSIVEGRWEDRAEALSATVAKLKEVAE